MNGLSDPAATTPADKDEVEERASTNGLAGGATPFIIDMRLDAKFSIDR
jgi:hypothetical protein